MAKLLAESSGLRMSQLPSNANTTCCNSEQTTGHHNNLCTFSNEWAGGTMWESSRTRVPGKKHIESFVWSLEMEAEVLKRSYGYQSAEVNKRMNRRLLLVFINRSTAWIWDEFQKMFQVKEKKMIDDVIVWLLLTRLSLQTIQQPERHSSCNFMVHATNSKTIH